MNIGPYAVMSIVGRGAMGIVYRAQSTVTGRVVAVKVITSEGEANAVLRGRFERECRSLMRLEHPNIAQGLDYGISDDGKPYLVMELVEGDRLEGLVHDVGPLDPGLVIRVGIQVAEALHAAHQHNLVHRDVKPDNVLLGRDGRAKLVDLGLVKCLDATGALTQSGAWLGTLDYMAPEQFESAKSADHLCDVYGLAGTLFFALTGARPFIGRAMAMLRRKLRNDFASPRQLVPALPEELDAVVCAGLDANPSARPQSCAEFAERLRAVPSPGSLARALAAGSDPSDQRRARRFPSRLSIVCRPVRPGEECWEGEIRDVSLTGVCLELGSPAEPSGLLSLEVNTPELPTLLLVHTRWVRQTGADRWSVGCAFTRPLSERELCSLLGGAPATVASCAD